MATTNEEGAVPDFLRMDQPVSSDPANARKTGNWHGWPTRDVTPVTLIDNEGRTVRIRTPVMDLEGLITPTSLHYNTVQHFAVPPVAASAAWELRMRVRWSYRWDARQKGHYHLMSRASDVVGRVQSHEPRYNHMRKDFSAIVGYRVTVA